MSDKFVPPVGWQYYTLTVGARHPGAIGSWSSFKRTVWAPSWEAAHHVMRELVVAAGYEYHPLRGDGCQL